MAKIRQTLRLAEISPANGQKSKGKEDKRGLRAVRNKSL